MRVTYGVVMCCVVHGNDSIAGTIAGRHRIHGYNAGDGMVVDYPDCLFNLFSVAFTSVLLSHFSLLPFSVVRALFPTHSVRDLYKIGKSLAFLLYGDSGFFAKFIVNTVFP